MADERANRVRRLFTGSEDSECVRFYPWPPEAAWEQGDPARAPDVNAATDQRMQSLPPLVSVEKTSAGG